MTYPYVQAYYDFGPRGSAPIKAFVIHMAEGGGTVGYLAKANPNKVSVHYVIERTGRIVQMLREDRISGSINPRDIRVSNDSKPPDPPFGVSTAKAVMGEWWDDPNRAVISLEIEGFARYGPNTAEVGSLRTLVADVRSRHPAIGLLGHRDFADYKACPGKLIPWDTLGGHGVATEESEEVVKSFPVYERPAFVQVKGGAWLYDNSDLTPSTGNVQINPGRELGYVGTLSDAVRIVAYESTTPDDNVSSMAMFVAATDLGSIRLETPVDCATAEAEGYNDGLDAALAAVRTIPRRDET